MDANGLKFWQLAGDGQFPGRRHAVWDASRRVLRLASERSLVTALAAPAAHAAAQGAIEAIPRAVDAREDIAWWDAGAGLVRAASYLPGDAPLLPLDETPTDLCAGHDGVLYVALPGRVHLHDLRGRFPGTDVSLAGFAPWRLAPAPDGGVWALERGTGRLARLTGYPRRYRTPQPDDYAPSVFRPCPENCQPPRLELRSGPLAAGEQALGLCVAEDGRPRVLTWVGGDGHAHVRTWLADQTRLDDPLHLQGADYAYAIAGLAGARVVVRVPGRIDAPAFDLDNVDQGTVPAAGEVYPLAEDAAEAPFCNGPADPPHYPAGAHGSQPLFPLSIANLARRGEAASYADAPAGFRACLLDSGDHTTVWHRLYAEADIPAQCGFTVWLAATNQARPPADDDLLAWHPHGFGRDAADPALLPGQVPRAAWERQASELPGHPGFLCQPPEPDRRGLFGVLIQNGRQRVRKLVGRYLWLRIELAGNGRAGPEIAALRAYAGRFDYVDHYLPRLYRESLFGAAATAPGEEVARIDGLFGADLDAGGPLSDVLRARLHVAGVNPGEAAAVTVEAADAAWLVADGRAAWRLRREGQVIVVYRPRASAADFTSRMLANFEGVLTQLEDWVAAAHLFSHPDAVPEANLDWLAGWIGVAFDAALPAQRRRAWLAAAAELARWHGTLRGLKLALEIASGGGVRGGEIVVLEDFRLRRILATLLGVDLSTEDDPLLPGLVVSGNSIVGDTLFLGDHERAELMALFREEAAGAAEDQAALDFYGRLANRATVLVHREVAEQDFALLRRIAQLAAPAHVAVRVTAATWPLLVGVASLVGVDTYLGPVRPPRPARVQRSVLGMGDYVLGEALLDPRLAGATPAPIPPTANAGADFQIGWGTSFILDGGASRAADGHDIAGYRWRLLPPETPE